MIRRAFLLLALLGTLPGLTAEPATGASGGAGARAGETGLTDQDERWSVAVCAFRPRNLSDEHAYLAVGLPLLLRERLETIPSHDLSPEEIVGQRRMILSRERQAVEELLGKARRERDRLLFGDLKPAALERKLEGQDEAIAGLQDRLAELAGIEPSRIAVPERKPVEFLEGKADGGLLDPPAFSALRYARDQGAELLIGGELQELEGYLYLEIFALDVVREEEVFSYRDALRPEEVYTALEGAAGGLAEVVLGQPFGTIVLPDLAEGCQVWLDGRFAGTDLAVLRYLQPGEHSVRVRCPGGREGEQQVVLEAGATQRLSFDLQARPETVVRLDSVPSGARVWSGSLYLGTTPLDVPRPEGSTRLLLRLDGYGDTAWYLEPATPAELTLRLRPPRQDPARLQRQQRDRFYRSFGLWALSLPLPFFLYGQTVDYSVAARSAYDQLKLSEAERLARLGQITWYGYLGGLALNVGLLVNMAFHLRDYIRSADRRAGG